MRTLSFLLLFFGGIAFLIMASNGSVIWFVNLPSFLGHFIILTSVIVATSSFKVFISGINGAFSKKYQMTKEQSDITLALFRLLQRTVNYTSVLVFLIGLVIGLGYLSDLFMLGPILAMTMIAPLYGIIINIAFINLVIYNLEHKHESESATVVRIKDKEVADKLLQLCFEKGLTHEDIMEADEITLRKRG